MLIEWKSQQYLNLPLEDDEFRCTPGEYIDLAKYERVAFILESQQMLGVLGLKVYSAPEDTTLGRGWLLVGSTSISNPTTRGDAYGRFVVYRDDRTSVAPTGNMARVFRWLLVNEDPAVPCSGDVRILIETADPDCSCGG